MKTRSVLPLFLYLTFLFGEEMSHKEIAAFRTTDELIAGLVSPLTGHIVQTNVDLTVSAVEPLHFLRFYEPYSSGAEEIFNSTCSVWRFIPYITNEYKNAVTPNESHKGLLMEKPKPLNDFSKPCLESQIASKIRNKVAKKLKKEQNLLCIGTGSRMMNEIAMLAMSFAYYKEVDLKKARRLLVIAIRDFLHAINSSEEIRPYLKNYPFTVKELEVVIFMFQPNGSEVEMGKISLFKCNRNNVEFYIQEPNPFMKPPFHTETYEEALHIVEEEEQKGRNTHSRT